LLALPRSGAALTCIFSVSSSQPEIAVRDAPGMTLSFSWTGILQSCVMAER
jgi:hypothetical protein